MTRWKVLGRTRYVRSEQRVLDDGLRHQARVTYVGEVFVDVVELKFRTSDKYLKHAGTGRRGWKETFNAFDPVAPGGTDRRVRESVLKHDPSCPNQNSHEIVASKTEVAPGRGSETSESPIPCPCTP